MFIPPELLAMLMGQGGAPKAAGMGAGMSPFGGGVGGQITGRPGGGMQGQLGPSGVGFFSGGTGASIGPQGLNVGAGGKNFSLGAGGFSMSDQDEEDSIPGPQRVFKKLMRKQYPLVSQSADRLAGTAIREASRGANAAGMGNSAVLQSIRDSATRNASEEKAGARDQFLQQAFDITGARQKAAAFQTMTDAAGRMGGGSPAASAAPAVVGGGAPAKPSTDTPASPSGMMGGLQSIGSLFGLGGANKPQTTEANAAPPGGETEEERRRRLMANAGYSMNPAGGW